MVIHKLHLSCNIISCILIDNESLIMVERSFIMGTFIVTVLGFSALILITGGILIHYLLVGLDTSTATLVDPKPKN